MLDVVAQQDALQFCVHKAAIRTCMPLVRRRRVTPMRKELTMRKNCKCGVCWKRARMNSGKKVISRRDNKN